MDLKTALKHYHSYLLLYNYLIPLMLIQLQHNYRTDLHPFQLHHQHYHQHYQQLLQDFEDHLQVYQPQPYQPNQHLRQQLWYIYHHQLLQIRQLILHLMRNLLELLKLLSCLCKNHHHLS